MTDRRRGADDVGSVDAISADRRQLIADLANDEWVDRLAENVSEDAALFEQAAAEWAARAELFLSSSTDPTELHLFAELFNWDGGVEDLHRLVANVNCEAATALMLYWRAQPQWYLQYASEAEVPSHERDTFALIQSIETRFLQGDYRVGSLSYDPRASGDMGTPPSKCVRTLPPAMLQAIVSRAHGSDRREGTTT